MMFMLNYRVFSSWYEQIGVSSWFTRIASDAFVLMQFAEQTQVGCHHSHDDAVSILMIFLTSPSLAWIVAFFPF